MDEIRDAYRNATGEEPPDSLSSEISSLTRRGVLEITGGRPGHSRYAPADLDLEEDEGGGPEDDTLVVFKALRSGYDRLERALSTAEVDREIERTGQALQSDHPDAVKKRLETLSRRTERGPEDFREPKVRRVQATSMLGQSSNHWVPAEVEAPAEELIAPRSEADAVRRTVYEAEGDLGRPPSRQELRWWLESPAAPEPILSVLDPDRLGTRLSDTARADEGHEGELGRLQPVTTSCSCHGGPPRRWTVGEVSARQQAQCELEATLHAYRVPEEIRSLRGLQRRADRRDSNVLDDLVATRRQLLLGSLAEAAGEHDAPDLLASLEEAYTTLQERVEATEGLSSDVRSQRRSRLRERLQAVRSTRGAFRFMEGPEAPPDLDRAGEAGTVRLEEFDPVLEDVGRILDLGDRQARQLVAEVRRFPPQEESDRNRIGEGPSPSLSVLDRVGAFQAVYELFTAPRTRTLLTEAQQLLGHVLRDAEYIENLIDDLETSSPPERPALVVALGLLGEHQPLDQAVVSRSNPEQVQAWILAGVLVDWREVASSLEAALTELPTASQDCVEGALRRIQSGYLASAIG